MQTFALLGTHKNLSLAEIYAVTGDRPANNNSSNSLAIFDEADWNFSDLQNKLGGTQKLGVVIGTVTDLDPKELSAFLASDLIDQVPAGKINFGLSIYGEDEAKLTHARQVLKNLGYELKTYLKNLNRSARYVISKEATLSSVVLKNNDLLTKGAEFVFLIRENDVVIGKTLAAQDVDEWSHRDMNRPRRNAKQGMLPPKLARIMVNLAQVKPGSTVLDPFCGSGTVLMEAGLLGASQLLGGDIAQMAISDTEANLTWLRAEHKTLPEPSLYTMRASDLGQALAEESIDCIVTETYLGRPRKGRETEEEIQETLAYVKTLYEESFGALKKILKPNGVVILTVPVHVLGNQELTFDAITLLESLGYKHEPQPFEPLIYRHKNQLVGRRLLKFSC